MHGDINLPLKGDTIHVSVPPEQRSKILSTEISSELEAKYKSEVEHALMAKESYLASLPEVEREKQIVQTSISTAVNVMSTSTTTTTTPPPEKYKRPSGEEDDSGITVMPSGGPPKSGGFDDEGETM